MFDRRSVLISNPKTKKIAVYILISSVVLLALSEIAKHTEELAQAVVDQGAVPYLAALISHPDAQLKRYVC
jgi:hypothetical protein